MSRREQRILDQLEKWVAGESVHNEEDNECCPDFSCCNPELLASEEDRKLFLALFKKGDEDSERAREGMLFEFLGAFIAYKLPDANVEILDPVKDVRKNN